MSTSPTRIRAGAAALAAAGVLFLAYPALRPWHDEGTVAGAAALDRPGTTRRPPPRRRRLCGYGLRK